MANKPQPQRARTRATASAKSAKSARKAPRDNARGLLTTEVQTAICAALERAVPLKFAALAAGVGERTVHEWIQRGERGEQAYAQFSAAVACAKGKAVVNLTDKALAGGPGSAQATFLLERRYRDEYGAAQRIEHAGSISLPTAQEDRIAQAIRGNPKALDGVQAVITKFANEEATDAAAAR